MSFLEMSCYNSAPNISGCILGKKTSFSECGDALSLVAQRGERGGRGSLTEAIQEPWRCGTEGHSSVGNTGGFLNLCCLNSSPFVSGERNIVHII